MPRAKRVAWVALGLLALAIVFATPWQGLFYRHVERVGTEGHRRVQEFSFISEEEAERETQAASNQPVVQVWFNRIEEPRLSWLPAGPVLLVQWFRTENGVDVMLQASRPPPDLESTDYFDGSIFQKRLNGETWEDATGPPWLFPLPYHPDDLPALIHEAKLSVQQAAADGEIVLPDWWELTE